MMEITENPSTHYGPSEVIYIHSEAQVSVRRIYTHSSVVRSPRNGEMKIKVASGQGLAEFAILLPVLILFIMIIFDLGRMAYYYSAIHNAAREGARYAAIHHESATSSDIAAAARRLVAGLDGNLMSITSSYPTEDTVRVTITYQFGTATPIISRLRGSANNTLTLTSQATMQLEK